MSQFLEDRVSLLEADMPNADDLMLRIYAAMAQKERELISEWTNAALAAAKARGKAVGGDRGYRPAGAPDAVAATLARQERAKRAAYRLAVQLEPTRMQGVEGNAALARAMNERGIPTPRGSGLWTHTTVARIVKRSAG